MKEGVEVNDELDFFEDIKAVGQGGHFLKQKNTRAAFRTGQFYQAMLCDRDSYDGWVNLGKPDMFGLAHKKAKEILESEPKNPLPDKTEKQLLEIMEEAKRKLCE
jgi:trimethylamine:corrinoid methyltransferase-like protein